MMQYSGLGDLASHFSSSRNNTRIRTELDRLAHELSTGKHADLARQLTTSADRVPDTTRALQLGRTSLQTAGLLADRLDVAQLSLGAVAATRETLFESITALSQSSGNAWHGTSAGLGAEALADIVSALNTRFAGTAVFSGVAEDQTPFADADTILTDIRTNVAGLTTAQDVVDAVNSWFDDAGGGFETIAYQGDQGALATRQIDDTTRVTLDARGDDAGIREVMKGAVLAALADDTGMALPDAERDALVFRATDQLLAASAPLVDLQARVGADQERTEDARARITAEVSAYEIMYNNLVGADPFETASELEQMQLQLETHYAVTARLSQLSLTRYL